ncbi:hypothetical protein QA861_14750 [Streptomyces sp. B21-083]
MRRARLGARRHDPGPGGRPARRVAARTRPRAGVRRPRSRRGTPGQRPGRGDAAGPDRRIGARRRGVRQSEGPLHPAVAGRRTRSGPGDRCPPSCRPPGVDTRLTTQVFVTTRARMIS